MVSHDFDRRTMRTPVSAWDPPAEALKLKNEAGGPCDSGLLPPKKEKS